MLRLDKTFSQSTECGWRPVVALLIVSSVVIALTWIGYRGYADDVMTIRGAQAWLSSFPYLGETHWELRHPYVLAMAGAIFSLGLSEFSVLAANLLALLLLIAITAGLLCRWSGERTAIASIILLLATPVFVFSGSTIFPGVVELLFVVASVAFFLSARKASDRMQTGYLVAAGLLLGFAFSVRETSLGLLVAYLLAGLFGFGLRRYKYLFLLAGFALIVALEVGLTWTASGDPFYRYRIDIAQEHPWAEIENYSFVEGETLPPTEMPTAAKGSGKDDSPDRGITEGGSGDDQHAAGGLSFALLSRVIRGPSTGEAVLPIDFGRHINPYASLFINHEFGVIFYLASVSLLVCIAFPSVRRAVPKEVWFLLLLAACWFVVQTYVFGLRQHPRYYLPTAIGAVLLSGSVLAALSRTPLKWLATVLILGACGVGFLAYDLQSERPRTERIYAKVIADLDEPVATSEDLVRRARFFLQVGRLEGLAASNCEGKAGFVFASENDADMLEQCRSAGREVTAVRQEWPGRERLLGRVLKTLGVLQSLPEGLQRKLYLPEPTLRLYEISPLGPAALGRG